MENAVDFTDEFQRRSEKRGEVQRSEQKRTVTGEGRAGRDERESDLNAREREQERERERERKKEDEEEATETPGEHPSLSGASS